MHATCHIHHTLLDSIILITFSEEYKKAVTDTEQGCRQLVYELLFMSAVMYTYVCCRSVSSTHIVMSRLAYKHSKANIYSVTYISRQTLAAFLLPLNAHRTKRQRIQNSVSSNFNNVNVLIF
jgi:hypothetical protein